MSGLQNFDLPYRSGKAHLSVKSNQNKSVVITLPGQTLPPQMFFDIRIYPDGSSISDKIVLNGFDIAHLNPIGYGYSEGIITDLYTRDTMADQVCLAVDLLRSTYENIFLHGFCSTSHVPMIAACKKQIEGIVAQSPLSFRVGPNYYKEYMNNRINDPFLHNSLDNLKENRLKKKSDVLLGYSNKVDNWESLFVDHLKIFKNFKEDGKWFGVNDMVWDLWVYVSKNATQGWVIDEIECPISIMVGEKDYECSTHDFNRFVYDVRSKLVSKNVVPNGTHFGMWDKNYDQWADTFIKCLQDLFVAQQSIKIKSAVNNINLSKSDLSQSI